MSDIYVHHNHLVWVYEGVSATYVRQWLGCADDQCPMYKILTQEVR
jgi:hypothetical protein